jgi:hypothetical protein
VVVACFGLAGLSLLVPYAMRSDPFAWLIWGDEVRHLTLDTTKGPAWKPLVLPVTTVVSLFGDSAPDVLLVVVRAAWLLAVALAFRIGRQLGGPAAGAIGAAGLLLIPGASAEWAGLVLEGGFDPLIAALVLAAIDRHLAGRRPQALALGCLAALGRPEAWPLAVLYGVAVCRVERRRAPAMAALLAVVPALWVGGSLWGSGDPLGAAHQAQGALEYVAGETATLADRALFSLQTAGQLVILPYGVAALFAVARAIGRVRRGGDGSDRVTIALGAGALGWVVIVIPHTRSTAERTLAPSPGSSATKTSAFPFARSRYRQLLAQPAAYLGGRLGGTVQG